MELKKLEKKYEELGKEIERLKKEQGFVGFKDDPIFLLSSEEYEKYRDKVSKISCFWWLRSHGYLSNKVDMCSRVMCVNIDGSICSSGYRIGHNDRGVRPALKISDFVATKLQKFIPIINANQPQSYHKFGDRIVFNGVTWIKLTDDIYIAEMPIDFRRFDEESNNYEESEIRKFLLQWFEERKVFNC